MEEKNLESKITKDVLKVMKKICKYYNKELNYICKYMEENKRNNIENF